jgi:hypothetical protein
MKKLLKQEITWLMSEFKTGWSFEFWYWKEEYAVCLASKWFLYPTDLILSYKVGVKTSLAQCSKELIKCLDNWDKWTSQTE